MQKVTDGHDTDVGTSGPWLWSRCVAAPQDGPALDGPAAGWPPAGEAAPDPAGADDDPVHPAIAPISSMGTQAITSPSRLVCFVATVKPYPFVIRPDSALL